MLFLLFIDKCKSLKLSEETISSIEKEGVDTGLTAINPLDKNAFLQGS